MPRYLISKDAICQDLTCTQKVFAREFCQKHYMKNYRMDAYKCQVDGCWSRWIAKVKPYCRRHLQDPTAPLKKYARSSKQSKTPTLQELKDKTVTNPEGCWLWQGANRSGYGVVDTTLDGVRFKSAHRLAYALANGVPRKGMQVHHACANAACINPAHLSLVTPEANIAEMHERRRYASIIANQALEIDKLREKLDACLCVAVR